jgi:hypothetical protein
MLAKKQHGEFNIFMTTSDWIQAVLALITLLAVLVALFGARLWRWQDRPRLKIDFNKNSERCFRWAIIEANNVQDEGVFSKVKKYYFRLRVQNIGGVARNLRARCDVLGSDFQPLDRFEPTTLNWINSKESLDLARGESEYVNLISQVVSNQSIKNRLTIEVFNTSPRGIAWDRPLKEYIFEVTLYGDNFKPVSTQFRFMPNTDVDKPGELFRYRRPTFWQP